jgi:DivIVA domain-containing protein
MLRSDDVADKTFTTTRLREGYEIAEVDEFRTEVVEALSLRDRVISEMQEELAAVRVRLAEVDRHECPETRFSAADHGEGEQSDGNRRESSVYAARLLERAALNADQLVAEARTAAESLVSAARTESEQLLAASRLETERAAVDLDQHRSKVLTEIADVQRDLEGKIEHLRQQESENRNRLRVHFTEQLAQLDDSSPAKLRAVAD